MQQDRRPAWRQGTAVGVVSHGSGPVSLAPHDARFFRALRFIQDKPRCPPACRPPRFPSSECCHRRAAPGSNRCQRAHCQQKLRRLHRFVSPDTPKAIARTNGRRRGKIVTLYLNSPSEKTIALETSKSAFFQASAGTQPSVPDGAAWFRDPNLLGATCGKKVARSIRWTG